MKNILLRCLIFLVILYPLALHAQWAKTYGRIENDQIYAITETRYGGYVAVKMEELLLREAMKKWPTIFVRLWCLCWMQMETLSGNSCILRMKILASLL